MFQRSLRVAGLLSLAALVAAGCGSGDSDTSSTKVSSKEKLPPSPATTLDRSEFGDAVTVTKGTTHDADITIDRASGRIYVSWAEDKPKPKDANFTPQDAWVAYSDDGGKSFSEPVRANHDAGTVNAGFNTSTKIASTGDDRLLATWPLMNDDMSQMNIMTALSTDGGKTFAKERPITGKTGSVGMYQGMATFGKNAFVGYLDYASAQTGILLVHSADGGKTFSEPMQAELTTCACCDDALAVDSKGTVFFAYRNQDKVTKNTQIRDTAVVRSYDMGKTWTDPVMLGKDNWAFNGCPESGPELAIDGKDNLHGVYYTGKPGRPGVYYTWSQDGGKSFHKPLAVAVDSFYPPSYMDVAVEKDGTAWIVWDDRRTKHRKVNLARAEGDTLTTLSKPLSDGITPTIDSDGSMVALAWSDDDGLHVATRGEAAKDGYGSGPGDASSGQEMKMEHGH